MKRSPRRPCCFTRAYATPGDQVQTPIGETAGLTFAYLISGKGSLNSVVGFTLDKRISTDYVAAWLSFIQKYLEESASESAQKNINLEILRGLKMPLPPLPFQQEYTAIARRFSRLQAQQAEATRQADHLFQSLLAQAFAPDDASEAATAD